MADNSDSSKKHKADDDDKPSGLSVPKAGLADMLKGGIGGAGVPKAGLEVMFKGGIGSAGVNFVRSSVNLVDSATAEKARELYDQMTSLRKKLDNLSAELAKQKKGGEQKAKVIDRLESTIKEFTEKEDLSFLLTRVNEQAQTLLLKSEDFRKKFEVPECDAFVMSIDIRRSTELMSKARSPQQFAIFMTTLCEGLESIIKAHYGVFDKFTGDGVLAFFPDFFSGEDSGFYVISAAYESHQLFDRLYKEFRSSFISVLTGVGLGIGVDYGTAHIVKIAGGLTVVGAPVVYACRMGGAPVGKTLLNQRGYEEVSEKFSNYCLFSETEIDIKNEGHTLAYEVRLNGKEYSHRLPQWTELLNKLNKNK